METAVSLGEHSPEPDFNHPTPVSLSSQGGRWNVFGSEVPKEEIVFFTQVILIYIIAITSIVNLTMEAKNDTLWHSMDISTQREFGVHATCFSTKQSQEETDIRRILYLWIDI